MPTPSGVPVEITSPGSSVTMEERKAIISSGLKTINRVDESCFVTPLTRRVRCKSCHPLLTQGCRGRSLPAGVWGVPQYGSNKAKVRSGLTRPEPESGESPDPVPKEVHANVQVSCAHSASAPV